MSTHQDQTSEFRGFPGGRATLPRLNKPKKLVDPEVEAEADSSDAHDRTADPTPQDRGSNRSRDEAGHRDAPADATADGKAGRARQRPAGAGGPIRRTKAAEGADEREVDGSFLDYFTADSLFSATPDHGGDVSDATAAAYATLGVSRRAPWKTVVRAHRELVAMLHPDRYVDADDEVRAAAEERVRDVNQAYALLREQRTPSRA